MTPWSDLLPHVLPYAPGCPDPVAEFHLRLAAQDFCARTHVWQATMDPIAVTQAAGFGPYDLNLPTRAELLKLQSATMDGREIDVLPESALPNDWRDNPSAIRDCVFTLDRLTVQVVPVYEASRTLVIKGSFAPADNADGLDDEIGRFYRDAIAAGALERILLLPAYSNPGLAMLKGEAFKAAIGKTVIKVGRGHSSFRPRVVATTY